MKIVRFIPNNSFPKAPRLGAILDSKIVDLESAYRLYLLDSNYCSSNAAFRISRQLLPSNTVRFLENGCLSMSAAENAIGFARSYGNESEVEKPLYGYNEVKLLSPIERPPSMRDYLSFEEHIKNARKIRGLEVPAEWYKRPSHYKGNPATIIGHEEDVVWPEFTEELDYELEFACVIGKDGSDIKASDADDHIFGYMIMNDFSARDIQMKEMGMGLGPGKGKDFATSLGPCIVTKDEIPDPYNMEMIARVNGEVWSKGNTNTMYRKFTDIIEYASQNESIVAGDILGSGTVGTGCGLELGKLLNDGDIVELEITGLGILRNRIVKRQQ